MKNLFTPFLVLLSTLAICQVTGETAKGISIHESCDNVGHRYATDYEEISIFHVTNKDKADYILLVLKGYNGEIDKHNVEMNNVESYDLGHGLTYLVTEYGPDGERTELHLNQEKKQIMLTTNTMPCSTIYSGNIAFFEIVMMYLKSKATPYKSN